MNTEQVPNPLNFHCASNQATPDYIIYDDFGSFVAYGLWVCWLGDDNDPNADCYFARPITKQDVKELRGYFLDILESVLMALLQKKVEPGYGEVDGNWPSLHIAHWKTDNLKPMYGTNMMKNIMKLIRKLHVCCWQK